MHTRATRSLTRRGFVKSAAAAATASAVFPHVGFGQASDRPLNVGVIGCGGRGTGAAENAVAADPKVRIVALADIARDRLDACRAHLKAKCSQEIEDSRCFAGPEAYKSLCELKLDYVILATPPYYRPVHFVTAVLSGKHVFMEKPIAVDAPGARTVLATGEAADRQKLCVVAGTQRRHHKGYIETIRRIHDGAIGQVVGGQIFWNQSQLWYRLREEGWSDSEWMHRDWVNWTWLSGDHVVEQHLHNIDVMNWVMRSHPVKALAFGGRHRRVTGDQYDFFCGDLVWPGEVHVQTTCRQINGCANAVGERVVGQSGQSNCNGWFSTTGELKVESPDPYVQEHKDLIDAIRSGQPLNETRNVAESTLAAIMVRQSAYTGKEVTWEQVMESKEELKAPDYELTPENIRAHIPVPGSESNKS